MLQTVMPNTYGKWGKYPKTFLVGDWMDDLKMLDILLYENIFYNIM